MKLTLKAARVNKGYTQRSLADLLGVSRISVIKWELGYVKMTDEHMDAFCNLCGVNKKDILLPTNSTESKLR